MAMILGMLERMGVANLRSVGELMGMNEDGVRKHKVYEHHNHCCRE